MSRGSLDRTKLLKLRIVIAAAICAGLLQFSGALKAQIKTTRLPDGVVKYESQMSATKSPPFWQIFLSQFKFAPTNRPFERSVAFLLGVSSYKYLDPQLPYVKSDLEDLRGFLLGQGGFDVVYVASDDVVTAELVEDYMVNRLPKELGDNDRLLFYYSGHGADIGGATGYMQFSQARKEAYSPSQYLPITRTQEWSKIIKAKHVLFLLDSCASGLGFESKSGPPDVDDDLLNTLSGNGSRFVITAGTAREKAFEVEESAGRGYSIFTRSFLEVLRANSEAYRDKGFLVLDEVFAETKIRVERLASNRGRKMTPHLWPIPRDGRDDVGTFIFLNKDNKGVSASSRTKVQLGIRAKESAAIPASRYARFLKGEVAQIGKEVPEAVRKNVARAVLEMELTWSYGSPNASKGDLLGGDSLTPSPEDVSQSPQWMTHFVNTARSAAFTLPIDVSQWNAGDIDENKKILAWLSGLVVSEKWSHNGGVARLVQLLPEGQPLIVKEFVDISNRGNSLGAWRLQLELGELLQDGPNVDLTLRGYGTVIRWNNVSPSNSLVAGLVGCAGKIAPEDEFRQWFSTMANMPYTDYLNQVAAVNVRLEERSDQIAVDRASGRDGATTRTTPQQAAAAIQPPAQVNQAAPPTWLERVTQINKNLAKGDRDRLSDAFFDYSKFLDQGSDLYYSANSEGGQIQQGRENGSIAKDFDVHIKKLRDADVSAKAYSKAFTQIRDKWKYYPDQTGYIFGDNPDNLGPNTLINGVSAFANYLDNWAKISNKDEQSILILLAYQQNEFSDSLNRFMRWIQGCEQRLEQMKKSIQ